LPNIALICIPSSLSTVTGIFFDQWRFDVSL